MMYRIIRQLNTALRNPKNAVSLIRHRIGSQTSKYFAPVIGYSAPPPEAINIYPTDRCNLNCAMCFEKLRKPRKELSLENWQRIITQLARFAPRVHLSGGEPLLYKYIAEIITGIKQHDLFLAITTNGTFLEDVASVITDCRVNTITVSIDGPRAVHDTIRGVPGAFDSLIRGLDALARYKECSIHPVLRINSMLNPSEPAAMQEVIRIGMEYKADTIQFIHQLFVGEQDLTAHRHFLKTALGTELNYWQGAQSVSQDNVDISALAAICKDLTREKGIQIEIFPRFTEQQMRLYYARDSKFYCLITGQCHAMWSTATILPSGEVESCPDYIVGNCAQTPITMLWNGPAMKSLRKRIYEKRFFTVCRACCFFYL